VKCPKCHDELRETSFGEYGFEILDVCPSCDGAWFDKGELDALDDSVLTNVEALSFRPAKLGDVRYACPRCGGDLDPVSPEDDPHLVIDRCPACEGFWLDPGELEALREISLEKDDKRLDSMKHIQRPADWSWFRWMAYNLRFRR
jgi:Zn-finger nucleic acid-binding protein